MAHSELYKKIMNSKAWHVCRDAKRAANPICERCWSEYKKVVPTQCIHHIIPIESGRNDRECWELAIRDSNLQSLCFAHHAAIHKAERSHSKEAHQQRTADRLEAWKARRKSFDQILTENEDVLARLKRGGPPDGLLIREGEKPPNPLAPSSVET